MKKYILRKYCALLMFLCSLCAIFFLTFQSSEDSLKITEIVQDTVYHIDDSKLSGEQVPNQFNSSETRSAYLMEIWKEMRRYAHILEYFSLGVSAAWMFLEFSQHFYIKAVAISMLVSFIDQVIKFFLPTREFEFGDLFFDFIGYSLGAGMVYLIYKVAKKPR